MSKYKLIIFDFDGTLADTRANIVLTMQQTLQKLGYPVAREEAIAATIGIPLEEGFIQLIPGLEKAEANSCATAYREIFEKNRRTLVPKPFPHVQDTLKTLYAKGYTLAVASSRSSSSLNAFLAEMGIAPYISHVLGADNVSKPKPDPEPVLITLKETGFEACQTLVVGDMPVDILMGARAGAKTCAVTYGNASRDVLAAAGADFIVDDLAMLPQILKMIFIENGHKNSGTV